MNSTPQNPFSITKADDFSDQEINDFWVDVSGGGFFQLAKPTSLMSMMILGGKGSGKTHLMRHFSYQLQRIRHSSDLVKNIKKEGYIGIYLRCGDLNSPRFEGKGQDKDDWAKIFSYYMDLWVAQILLTTIQDVFKSNTLSIESELSICRDIISLFTHSDFDKPTTLSDLLNMIKALQREIDIEVNESGYTHFTNIINRTKLGGLTFGIPKIIANYIPLLKNVIFLYLVDEFENLNEEQQKYFNTLVRQRQGPCTFRIGSRLYGIYTNKTFNANEVIKEGAEYEPLFLDDQLRMNKGYSKFAKELCIKRLINYGYMQQSNEDNLSKRLSSFFETYSNISFNKDETDAIIGPPSEKERPYFNKLRQRLQRGAIVYNLSSYDIKNVIDCLQIPEYPLLEKINIYLLYKNMYAGINPKIVAPIIYNQCKEFIANRHRRGIYYQAFSHFKKDMLAQLLFDYGKKQNYLGIDTFISMSCGLPRNFLIILKYIFRWSFFNGESPFESSPISSRAQREGVLEASNWFFEDARKSGEEGRIIQQGVGNLANFFREVRFSDKPSECSLSSFSTNISRTSEQSQKNIEEAVKWSLLIKIKRGQPHRNTRRIDAKYQLNSMLSPRWELPIFRRGTIDLNFDEIDTIFDPSHFDETIILDKRIAGMKAPFFGKLIKRNKHNTKASLWKND